MFEDFSLYLYDEKKLKTNIQTIKINYKCNRTQTFITNNNKKQKKKKMNRLLWQDKPSQ